MTEAIIHYWNLIVSLAPIFLNKLIQAVLLYWKLIIFFIPLGVVGAWRWSVWLIKKIISLFYRSPVKAFHEGTLAIVTPVYNENPKVFETALYSWLQSGEPQEIIAVIDYTDKKCIAVFEKFARTRELARLIITEKPGKRTALADGVKAAHSEFVALVDSDTIWFGSMKDTILSPFADPQVGGVSTRQDIYNPDTLSKKLFQINLSNRYFNEMPFLAASGDAVTCLSGRTAIYRRSAIIGFMDELVNEKFLGEQMISGDDKTLTRLVQGAGWKVKYIRDAVVYTPGFAEIKPFLLQLVRWSRNSWRSDLITLSEGWVWKRNKILALHMIDRFFQPFTILLGPVYFVVSLALGYWKIALALFIWWLFSRSIKVYRHLKSHPRDIFIMPDYVLFTFVSALIKLYALLTVARQGWITRWHKSRLKRLPFLKQLPAYLFSFLIMVSYFAGVSFYHYRVLTATHAVKIPKEKVAAASLISTEPKLISDVELAQKKQDIADWKKSHSSGVYVTRAGETLFSLRNKFNLDPSIPLKYDSNLPVSSFGFLPVGQKITLPVQNIQNPLDANKLMAIRFTRKPPVIFFDKTINAIRVKSSGSIVTFSQINQALLGNKALLEQTKPGEWILRANLYIGKDVTLVIDKSDVSYLKLKSDATGHVWIRSQNGNMLFSNTKVTSWDEISQAPDSNYTGGRSYIVAKGSGRMDIVNSDIGYLGYVGLPRRGGPFGGSYGLSWKITSGKFNNDLLTGSVINSSIHNNFFGLYSFGATGIVIRNNEVFNNVQYGIDPHDDSNNLLIADNRVHDNGTHGIITSKRCFNNEIIGNISYNNKLHGIMLDRSSNNTLVQNNVTYGNIDGIVIYDSNYNFITGNNVYENKQGIRLNQNASANYIENNQISSNKTGLHIYGGAGQNFFVQNIVKNNDLGVSIQNASGNVLYSNFSSSDNKKEGYVTVSLNTNEIK
jgi:hyaluronan synthase